MAHRAEVIKTQDGWYGICSCGWHTKERANSIETARLQTNTHRLAEIQKAEAPAEPAPRPK